MFSSDYQVQHSCPSRQRSVSVSSIGEAEAQQSELGGRSTYDSEVTRTGSGSKYAAELRARKTVQLPT